MILYKYFGPARITIFDEWKLRFSPPTDFNDPFEMLPHTEIATASYASLHFDNQYEKVVLEMYDKLPEIVRRSVSREKVLELAGAYREQVRVGMLGDLASVSPSITKEFLGRVGELVGILCLSERRDSLLMWAHYAASHTGFVIGLDSEHSFFQRRRHVEDEFGYLRKLAYTRERPSVALADIKGLDEFFVKSIEWEYENEWRFPLPLARATEVSGAMEPISPLFDLPPSAIKEIIFGCRMAEQTTQTIRSALQSRPESKDYRFYQAEPDDTHFVLNFRELS